MMNECCTEPSLEEVLKDAATRLLMRSDGVSESDVRGLLRRVAAKLSPRTSDPGASPLPGRRLRPTWLIGLLAIAFIGVPEAHQALRAPSATIRSELTAAAVELARPVAARPTEGQLSAIRAHFPARDATVDASAWPQIAVTLRHLDQGTCDEVLGAARRIEGLVVVELERYRSAADCGQDNDMTWRITP
jgi:hypothetical protein